MNCPVCNTTLARVKYEGFAVRQCCTCRGYMVSMKHLALIRSTDEKTVEELMQEVAGETGRDNDETLRCPQCAKPMQRSRVPDPGSFDVDRCKRCQLVWLDGGELARYQLTWMGRNDETAEACPPAPVESAPLESASLESVPAESVLVVPTADESV